jgi:hypothetical protein
MEDAAKVSSDPNKTETLKNPCRKTIGLLTRLPPIPIAKSNL